MCSVIIGLLVCLPCLAQQTTRASFHSSGHPFVRVLYFLLFAQQGALGVPDRLPAQAKGYDSRAGHYGWFRLRDRVGFGTAGRGQDRPEAVQPTRIAAAASYGGTYIFLFLKQTVDYSGHKYKEHFGTNMNTKRCLHFRPKWYRVLFMSMHVSVFFLVSCFLFFFFFVLCFFHGCSRRSRQKLAGRVGWGYLTRPD